ncbi:MAG TPA: alpha-mannosidase [Candidatus Hydrogenedentes bacterium]|nr:alpha-mannosidase [Candidatus Hydrogenedentota bacterium]
MPFFDTERTIEAAQLRARIREIGDTIYSQRQAIGGLEFCVTGRGRGPERAPQTGWKPFSVGDRWGGYDQTTWFRLRATIPKSMKGNTVFALIRATTAPFVHGAPDMIEGGEALAYVNGVPMQGLDRNHDELHLLEKAKGGERFDIALEATPSTRHDHYHHFAYADIAVRDPRVWSFYWDCVVALEVWEQLDMNTTTARHFMAMLDESIYMVDLQHKGSPAYHASINKAQRHLRNGLKQFEKSSGMGKLVLAGHAHIDTAWLWPLRETRRKCARTFSTVLGLMDRYPEFHFSCSQPLQYEWIKTHYPELYARIKRRVKEGRWELCGAPWIEPDHNMPAGEALIRQYLYGNRWFEREFGKRSHIAWVPDSFGYTWSLPQIMRKAGLEAFVTTKIDWSQFTAFPYSMFDWEGIDGTKIFAVMPPLNYNGNPLPKDCIEQWKLFKQKELVDEVPFAFGWGDGGGGPTMNMLEHGKRLSNVVGVPRCEFGRLTDSVDRMRENSKGKQLPVYNGELYLELHRACQTTQARTKRHNRKSEVLLHDTEFFCALGSLDGVPYDHAGIWEAWKPVLMNQFHDILPGSSITEVYQQTEIDYLEAQEKAKAVQQRAVDALCKNIDTSGTGAPLVVFNSLSWVRSGVASVEFDARKPDIAVLDPSGHAVAHQWTGKSTLLFQVEGIPPLGWAVYRIIEGKRPAKSDAELRAGTTSMENEYLELRMDRDGRITRLFDKITERDSLAKGSPANVLQLFEDRPHLHDAWDFDHNFERKMWEPKTSEPPRVIENGPVRAVVRVVRRTDRSTITQDITLNAGSPRVEFVTRVDWHEKHVLLKAAFPVAIRSSRATYEIQYGAIERSTHHNTPFDRARFENTALRWVDLSEGDYGVSLLNDCKYGHDVRDNVLRISLLRSSTDPDPIADEGHHEFTYALYPHANDWRNDTVRQGLELNTPFVVHATTSRKGMLSPVASFASVDAENVVIDWIKKHEDSKALIIRLYEAYGQRGPVTITFDQKVRGISECNLMEEQDIPARVVENSVTLDITPFELRTLKVLFA